MRRRTLSVSIVIASMAALAWAGPSGAEPGKSNGRRGAVFATHMVGEQERPVLGDPDGFGNSHIRVGADNVVCYRLKVRKIEAPTAAHIHVAPRGEPGPVVVPLTGTWVQTPDRGYQLEGCTQASAATAAAILANPSQYYVNVHNQPYPGGAVRGQLA
jgi:hypothetical protein